jgi:acetolactate synthase regulatory subunit
VQTITTTSPPAHRCRLSLTTRADSDVVVRALMLLRRRGCTVVAVNYRRSDHHGPGCFEVSVEAPLRVGHRLEDWLRGLVDVVAVGPG